MKHVYFCYVVVQRSSDTDNFFVLWSINQEVVFIVSICLIGTDIELCVRVCTLHFSRRLLMMSVVW
jgi:hypothetical protein